MVAKRRLVVANWKMNLGVHAGSVLVHHLSKQIESRRSVEVVLAPSSLLLQPLSLEIDRHKFRLAAQNAYFKDSGGFTGEISFTMLRDLVHYCIVGHSERRIHFNEDLVVVREKVAAAVRNDIVPILCVGESRQEKRDGEANQVLHDQLVSALANLTSLEIADAVIAYEPVWAISTFDGELAKPAEVAGRLQFIRRQVADLYGPAAAQAVRLLYGGSVDNHTAKGYLSLDDCDGLLVGAASLSAPKFAAIVEAAYKSQHELRAKGGSAA